mmetsp:Transcript_42085/g.82545  ORF Transcript_42085/g.82545 Transcript_42085/m.82545 type:complete len:224 (-) Transcript_42085:85-756(-)|eukprot:CAMPEP_0194325264 /NCGR_PEP_ID=MMETSP0171-20130528/29136_1 /TAXON_ID=218684 /ORGANISM="Corethron pennatum, Strain L29A3" /LENGTH=223 /DNA_ID=CAMNT_0039084317 /DNA_START=162 /DNA_END=833 /DNA_ORIENTATION=-
MPLHRMFLTATILPILSWLQNTAKVSLTASDVVETVAPDAITIGIFSRDGIANKEHPQRYMMLDVAAHDRDLHSSSDSEEERPGTLLFYYEALSGIGRVGAGVLVGYAAAGLARAIASRAVRTTLLLHLLSEIANCVFSMLRAARSGNMDGGGAARVDKRTVDDEMEAVDGYLKARMREGRDGAVRAAREVWRSVVVHGKRAADGYPHFSAGFWAQFLLMMIM